MMFDDEDEDNMHFNIWYSRLRVLAKKHGERVSDVQAWRESFDEGLTAEDAFYGEYPEHKDASE